MDNLGCENHFRLIEKDISGGKITKEIINLIKNTNCTKITISGLQQDTFEYFIKNYGSRFIEINFWKCPRIEDLTPIESLTDIEKITYFWNQKAENLWDFSKNIKLRSFSFDDFTKMHDLSSLENSNSIEELEFGDKIWSKYVVNSLQPLSQIKNLRKLSFSAKNLIDNSVKPLSEIINLEEINFPAKMFSTEKVAWLTAHMPNILESNALRPYRRVLAVDGSMSDEVIIIGKRKPILDWNTDRNKIEKYISNFDELVKFYQNNTTLSEPD